MELEIDERDFDKSELVASAFHAYRLHPAYENFDVGVKPTSAKVLYDLDNRLKEVTHATGFFAEFVEYNGQYLVVLNEELPNVQDNITAELKYMVNLEKSDPELFHVLTSLIHYLIVDKKIPDWTELVTHVNSWDYCFEERDDDVDQNGDSKDRLALIMQGFEFYAKGLPALWLKRIQKYKPLKIKQLKSFRTSNQKLKTLIKNALLVIEHPLTFHDYCNPYDDEDGFNPWQYIYFSWDFDNAVDQEYSEYLDNNAYQTGIIPPRRLIPIERKDDWLSKSHGYTFFNPLITFFSTLRKILR